MFQNIKDWYNSNYTDTISRGNSCKSFTFFPSTTMVTYIITEVAKMVCKNCFLTSFHQETLNPVTLRFVVLMIFTSKIMRLQQYKYNPKFPKTLKNIILNQFNRNFTLFILVYFKIVTVLGTINIFKLSYVRQNSYEH